MKLYQVWTMPNPKEKGNHNKWMLVQESVEAKNRKEVKALYSQYQSGTLKIRMV